MAYAPQRALFRRDRFFLSLDARLFVMLSLAQLRQNASLFAQFFETTNGAFDGLVFANSNTCHKISSPPITTGRCQLMILAEFRIKSSNCLEQQGIYESPLLFNLLNDPGQHEIQPESSDHSYGAAIEREPRGIDGNGPVLRESSIRSNGSNRSKRFDRLKRLDRFELHLPEASLLRLT